MCRLRWSALSLDDDGCFDCFRWDFDCYDFVCLVCNSRPFDCVAEQLFEAMNMSGLHKTVVVAAVAGVFRRLYVACC